ncbi:MAG: hypothetical protein JSR17_12400 [Proteobacteria bacterium]|nr:hypothetical protein [Pseudomonadota bacterium]
MPKHKQHHESSVHVPGNTYTPKHHKNENQHLQNEQAFKSSQNFKQMPGIHRKILTTQKGGRRGG